MIICELCSSYWSHTQLSLHERSKITLKNFFLRRINTNTSIHSSCVCIATVNIEQWLRNGVKNFFSNWCECTLYMTTAAASHIEALWHTTLFIVPFVRRRLVRFASFMHSPRAVAAVVVVWGASWEWRKKYTLASKWIDGENACRSVGYLHSLRQQQVARFEIGVVWKLIKIVFSWIIFYLLFCIDFAIFCF